jgi:hypothetical protein
LSSFNWHENAIKALGVRRPVIAAALSRTSPTSDAAHHSVMRAPPNHVHLFEQDEANAIRFAQQMFSPEAGSKGEVRTIVNKLKFKLNSNKPKAPLPENSWRFDALLQIIGDVGLPSALTHGKTLPKG